MPNQHELQTMRSRPAHEIVNKLNKKGGQYLTKNMGSSILHHKGKYLRVAAGTDYSKSLFVNNQRVSNKATCSQAW